MGVDSQTLISGHVVAMFHCEDWDISNDRLQESLLGTHSKGKKKCESSFQSLAAREKNGCVAKHGRRRKLTSKRIKQVMKKELLKDEILIEEETDKAIEEKEKKQVTDKIGWEESTSTKSLSTFAHKVAKKMSGARFRWINQKLYTCTGNDATRFFTEEPHLFTVYHDGFREQVEKWPLNPLDNIIEYIKTCPREIVVADFGCGEARLAQSVPQMVHSFDFVSLNKHVVSCDMSHVPLHDSTVDVGVFCLSLMGINLLDYLLEAHRVIKLKGVLKICEIQSRIVSIDTFVKQVESFGFKLSRKMSLNKMFIDFEFVLKSKKNRDSKDLNVDLKPCLYKRR